MKRLLLLSLIFVTASAGAQTLSDAAALKKLYQFDKASAAYGKILQSDPAAAGALVGLVESENGRALLEYSARPEVLSQKRVPRKDFFLWYSHFADRSWTAEGVYFPEGAEVLLTARDGGIGWSELLDEKTWGAPEKVLEDVLTQGNVLFPMLSRDGRTLFFAADSLFGMGGFDLYSARWNERSKKWEDVSNLGFPYSSTGNDLLYCDTPDGKYTVFASDRDCGKDSVVIYVLRQENPVRSALSQSEAAAAAKLKVTEPDNSYFASKHSFCTLSGFEFEEAEEEFDYTLTVGQKGAFAENNVLPSGLVYQIQMFVTASKPSVKQLKGVSPVYLHKQPSGKYLCAAGLFRTYAEAEKALSKVKKAGFKTAFVIAYEDRSPIAVKKARENETSVTVITEEIHIVK